MAESPKREGPPGPHQVWRVPCSRFESHRLVHRKSKFRSRRLDVDTGLRADIHSHDPKGIGRGDIKVRQFHIDRSREACLSLALHDSSWRAKATERFSRSSLSSTTRLDCP